MSTKTRRKLSYEENQLKFVGPHVTPKNEKAREFISEQRIQQHQKICRPCRDDISRVIANPAFKPRWEKKKMYMNAAFKIASKAAT